MSRLVKIVLLISPLLFSKTVFSQDIQGGYINYKWISGFTYSINAIVITDTNITINRPTVMLMGSSTLTLNSTSLIGKRKINNYTGIETFSGPGFYTRAYNDSFRVATIKNISNSDGQFIYIESDINITGLSGPNSNPVINNYSFSPNVSGNQIVYNPAMYDSDGDSLSYQLINCSGIPSLNYYLPGGANVDNFGTLSFSKDSIGLYAFTYEIKEWRKDMTLNYVMMAISRFDFVLETDANVGIQEFDKKETLSIFPNPTSNIININSNSNNNSEIEVTNYLGETVLKQKYSESVDVSSLSSGYYIIKITGNKNLYSKFTKE